MIADRQTTINALLPFGGKTDPSDVDVRAHRVSIFACEGNHMGPKQKSDMGQGAMMSPSEDERTACDNKYVQNCVSMASSRDQPLIVGLGLDCYAVKGKEMFGAGCRARAHELMKKVWDCDVPCIPGDCIFSQVNNHPDYTKWSDMWHADFLAKSDRDKDSALRYYTRNACDDLPIHAPFCATLASFFAFLPRKKIYHPAARGHLRK